MTTIIKHASLDCTGSRVDAGDIVRIVSEGDGLFAQVDAVGVVRQVGVGDGTIKVFFFKGDFAPQIAGGWWVWAHHCVILDM